MDKTVKRAALYIRVSTDEQAKHGFSPPEQKADLTAYAQGKGYIIADIYADEGNTARKSLSNRKELQRLLADVKAGRIDIIIMKCLDRWFRNVRDYYNVQDILDAHGCLWECTQEEYNTTTTNGRLMLNLKLSIAQNESDQTSDRIKYVFEGKKARHEVLTGNLPYGYKVENKHYAIDPPKAAHIKDLFEYYATYQNMQKALDYMRGKYGMTLRHISIRRILANNAYIGIRYGIEGYCPAIINRGLFDRVQKILSKRRGKAVKGGRVFLFAGLIHCPECGRVLAGNRGHVINPDTGEYTFKIYRCSYHYIEHICNCTRSISENPLERYMLHDIQNLIRDYVIEMEIKAKSAPNPMQKVTAIKQKLERLKDLYVDGCIDRAAYSKDFERYNKELSSAMKAAAGKTRERHNELLPLLNTDIVGMYSKLTKENRQAFWRSIISSITPTSIKGRAPYTNNDFKVEFLA